MTGEMNMTDFPVVDKQCVRAGKKIGHVAHVYISKEMPEDEGFWAYCTGCDAPPEPTVEDDRDTLIRIGRTASFSSKDFTEVARIAVKGLTARELLTDEEALGNAVVSALSPWIEYPGGLETAAQDAATAIVKLATERGLQ